MRLLACALAVAGVFTALPVAAQSASAAPEGRAHHAWAGGFDLFVTGSTYKAIQVTSLATGRKTCTLVAEGWQWNAIPFTSNRAGVGATINPVPDCSRDWGLYPSNFRAHLGEHWTLDGRTATCVRYDGGPNHQCEDRL